MCSVQKREGVRLAQPQTRLGSLRALDDGATFLTSIPCAAALGCCQLLEFVTLGAAALETFRAKPVAQFFARDSQMAVPAPQGRLAFGQQLERAVRAGSHIEPREQTSKQGTGAPTPLAGP